MKRLLRGSVVLAVAIGFLSCSGDPTDSFREPSAIVASPSALFINVGETEPTIVTLTDDQGSPITAEYEISDVGPGIIVVQDTTFQHTTVPGQPIGYQSRFQVTATAIANSSFRVSASGQSLVVPVRVTPATVDVVISNPAPALGDTITLTAPAGVLFTDSSEVTFAGGPAGDIVTLSPDRTVLTVVPGPNTAGVVTIAHTTVSYDETLDFTITSNATVTSPALTDLAGATLSNQTPVLGEVVTLTLPAGVKVLPESVLADSGLVVEGAINPRSVTVSADSSVITFVPAPNSDSVLTVRGSVAQPLPQFPMILQTVLKVTTPVVDSAPATVSSATPLGGAAVTLTSTDAAFTYDAGTRVLVGADTAVTNSVAGGSMSFTPVPGSTGAVSVAGVQVVGFPLVLPTTAGTVTAGTTVAANPGTSAPATAPTIPEPVPGGSSGIVDGGLFGYAACGDIGLPCQVYKLVVTTAGSFNFSLRWSNQADLGLYFLGADLLDTGFHDCDAIGRGAAAGPEVCSTDLDPGTYYLAAVPFGQFYPENDPNPTWVTIRVWQD
jgi:hypothetical protein